ncbi:hypothetical protein DVS77_34255 [Mycolicibacterium moriokaense]|nr:hypothetical protein DVS77_34255 [Mycolicibacterium moriokaense]
MITLFHDELGSASDTVLGRPEHGVAAAARREEAPQAPARRRTLAALTAAVSATRRGFGD